MTRKDIELGVGIILVVLILAGAVLTLGNSGSTQMDGDSGGEASTNGAGDSGSTVTEASVTVGADGFTPSTLALAEGEVTVTIRNSDEERSHGFSIAELGVDQIVQPGDEKTITFTATAGEYTYYDPLSSENQGTLTVG